MASWDYRQMFHGIDPEHHVYRGLSLYGALAKGKAALCVPLDPLNVVHYLAQCVHSL
jgi:uncharacterized membrane protein